MQDDTEPRAQLTFILNGDGLVEFTKAQVAIKTTVMEPVKKSKMVSSVE